MGFPWPGFRLLLPHQYIYFWELVQIPDTYLAGTIMLDGWELNNKLNFKRPSSLSSTSLIACRYQPLMFNGLMSKNSLNKLMALLFHSAFRLLFSMWKKIFFLIVHSRERQQFSKTWSNLNHLIEQVSSDVYIYIYVCMYIFAQHLHSRMGHKVNFLSRIQQIWF